MSSSGPRYHASLTLRGAETAEVNLGTRSTPHVHRTAYKPTLLLHFYGLRVFYLKIDATLPFTVIIA